MYFLIRKKTLVYKIFQTLYDNNLALGLHFHSSSDDLGFVSRSLLCQKYKLQIVCF